MGGVFLSYRRDDTRWASLFLAEALRRRLGAKRVFHDVGAIAAGSDFARSIEAGLASCRVLVVLIGSAWNDRGRLHEPGDLVAREVSYGLSGGKAVLPVLVDAATMPRPETLPVELRALSGLQAEQLVYRSWGNHVERIVDFVEKEARVPAPSREVTFEDAKATGSARVMQLWTQSQQPSSPEPVELPPPPELPPPAATT